MFRTGVFARIKCQGSSQDCQLTFAQYCMSASKPRFLDSLLFSSIFLGLLFLQVTTCRLRGIYLRHLPLQLYNDLRYQSYILRKDNLNLLENKAQLSWQFWNKALCHVTALPHILNACLFFHLDHLRGHPDVVLAVGLKLTCSHVDYFVMSCSVLKSLTFSSFGNKFSSKKKEHALE